MSGAPFPYDNYIYESLCVVWLIISGLTVVRIMCLFLYNSGLKWLLLIVTKEFLLLKDGNSLQISHQFECCYASESTLPFSLCCSILYHLCCHQRHKLRCEPVVAPLSVLSTLDSSIDKITEIKFNVYLVHYLT